MATARIERISPEYAAELAQRPAHDQRPVSSPAVKALVEDIQSGRWATTGQGIMIGRGGVVVDGMTRLTAIARAGVPVDVLVYRDDSIDSARGIPIDRGRTRSRGYTLDEPEHLASVAGIISGWGGSARASDAVLSRICDKVRSEAEAVFAARPGAVRYWTAARARVAVIAAMHKMGEKAHGDVLRAFSDLAYQREGSMTPCVYRVWSAVVKDGRTYSEDQRAARIYDALTARGVRSMRWKAVDDPCWAELKAWAKRVRDEV